MNLRTTSLKHTSTVRKLRDFFSSSNLMVLRYAIKPITGVLHVYSTRWLNRQCWALLLCFYRLKHKKTINYTEICCFLRPLNSSECRLRNWPILNEGLLGRYYELANSVKLWTMNCYMTMPRFYMIDCTCFIRAPWPRCAHARWQARERALCTIQL